MNILAALGTLLAVNTWGWALFNLGEYPVWAPAYHNGNETFGNNHTVF